MFFSHTDSEQESYVHCWQNKLLKRPKTAWLLRRFLPYGLEFPPSIQPRTSLINNYKWSLAQLEWFRPILCPRYYGDRRFFKFSIPCAILKRRHQPCEELGKRDVNEGPKPNSETKPTAIGWIILALYHVSRYILRLFYVLHYNEECNSQKYSVHSRMIENDDNFSRYYRKHWNTGVYRLTNDSRS